MMNYATWVLNISDNWKPVNQKSEMFEMFEDVLDFDFFQLHLYVHLYVTSQEPYHVPKSIFQRLKLQQFWCCHHCPGEPVQCPTTLSFTLPSQWNGDLQLSPQSFLFSFKLDEQSVLCRILSAPFQLPSHFFPFLFFFFSF